MLSHLDPQLTVEEGDRQFVYDDATGRTFRKGDTLKGNLSVGTGINLMIGLDDAERAFMRRNRQTKMLNALRAYEWFNSQSLVRQTALLDLSFNIGFEGLLHWPHFLSAMSSHEYADAVDDIAQNRIWLSQVGPERSGRIEHMIVTDTWPTDIKEPT